MLLKMLVTSWCALTTYPPAHGALLEPIYRAAEINGYEVVGEFVFRRGGVHVPAEQIRANLAIARELCPQATHKGLPENHVHFVILAWSDYEFPNSKAYQIPTEQRCLADARARKVADLLRLGLKGSTLSFDIVNMASQKPQHVRVGSRAQLSPRFADIKAILRETGAAPTDALSMGLFGEYGQKAKAIVWMDCAEPHEEKPDRDVANTYQLARLN